MEHTSKDGQAKLVPTCTLPLTGRGVVSRVITDLGVFDTAGDGFDVVELAPGTSLEQVVAATAADVRRPG
jgi:3-oxoacid CoA-transferase subunit B